ncbi:DMT family transporter [Caproiciproducens sp.]
MKLKSVTSLLLLSVIWGVYYVATQRAVRVLSVFSVGIVVRFITMMILAVIMLAEGKFTDLFHTKGVTKRLFLIGGFGYLLDLTAFIGLSVSPAGSGTALLKCDVLFVNIISVLIYKYRFTRADWACSMVMLFGVFLVMGINFSSFRLGDAGNIFFILSALFVSINAFLIKSVQTSKVSAVSDHVVAFYNNFITMALFALSALFTGDFRQLAKIGGNAFIIVILLICSVGQSLIYIVYYDNLRRFPVWIVKVFLLLMPVVAALVSYMAFGERLVPMQYGGMAVVLLGALGILLEQKKKSQFQQNTVTEGVKEK